jgi:hypothetical protein
MVAIGFLVGAGPAQAAVKTVSFDDLPPGTDVTTQYQTSHGVFFPGPPEGAFPKTKTLAEAHSPGQVAEIPIIGESFNSYTVGRLTSTARTVSAFVGFTFNTPPSDTVTLEAYNSSNSSPIATSTVSVSQGAFTQQVSVTSPNVNADISHFVLKSANSVIGMDDLAITTPDTPSTADFGLAAPGDPANVPVGGFVDVPISISRLNGSNGDVSLAVTNLPPGMRAEITPNPVGGTGASATLRLSALDNADRFVDYREITITGTPGPGAGSGARTVKKLVRIVDNCMPRYRGDYIDARADCIKSIGPDKLQIVSQKVRLNGLVVEPASGDRALTIDTKKRTITSDGDLFAITHPDLPELPIYLGPINWDLGGTGSDPKSILDYDITGVKKLKGIPVQRLQATLTRSGKTNLRPTLRLSFWPFDYFGAITSTTQFTIDNDNGPDFSGLEIKADRVAVLGLELKDVSVKWQQGGTWAGGATVVLRFANAYEVGAGFGLKDGGFDFARGSVGGLNVAVSPGIFLQRIGFEVRRSPFSLAGTVGFSGGPSVAGKQAVTVDGTFKAVLDDPWILEVSGKAKVADRFELAEAFLRYSSDGLFELGAKAQWNLSVAYINGQIAGFVDGFDAFDLEGSVRGCISVKYLPDPCAGAKFLVSNIGIAACIDLTIVSGGVGYYWGGDFDLFGGSCDLSPWRPAHSISASAAGAGTARRYTLRAGLPSAAWAVEGVGDAPGLTLTGPRGEKVTVSRAQPYARAGNLVAMLSENGTTYLAVKRPAGGTWTITDDGLVAVRRVREAVGLPNPSVSARVTGRGRSRTLHWRLRPISGQRVRFVEVGKDVHKVIATVRAARGQVRFRPADGPAGRRRIVALVEQNRLLRKAVAAGSYVAPARPRPARPRNLRLARRGTRLVASWRAPQAGFRHAVHFKLGDGRQILQIAGARARSLTLRGVAARYGARVTVAGLTKANGRGPAARASIAGRPGARPAAGTWRMTTAFVSTQKGSFRVAGGGRFVTDLRLTPGSGAGAKCGTAELRVLGRTALSRASRAGAAIWIVGRRAPRALDGAATRTVRVRRGSRRLRGALKLSFDGRRKVSGELTVPGCRALFNAQR